MDIDAKRKNMKSRTAAVFNGLMMRYPALETCLEDIIDAYEMILKCYRDSAGKILICGNGGSASDAEHITGEFMKGFILKRPVPAEFRDKLAGVCGIADGEYIASNLQGALPAISLVSQSAVITAFSNDVAPDMAFAQQVYGYGRPGDILIGLSTSGNSQNIINAVKTAKAIGMGTIGMTGASGGKLAELCGVTIRAPEKETYLAQELHLPIYHALCAMVESELFEC